MNQRTAALLKMNTGRQNIVEPWRIKAVMEREKVSEKRAVEIILQRREAETKPR